MAGREDLEELRASEKERRSQQEHIAALIGEQDKMRLDREHMLAILPVPTLLTDQRGVIRACNAATAALLRTRQGRLIGTSALSFIAPHDRDQLTRALSERTLAEAPVRCALTLTTPEQPLTVHVSLTEHESGVVSWVLLRVATDRDTLVEGLLETLAALSTLPVTASDLQPALDAASAVVAHTLGSGVEVSISAGPPLEPRVVASSAALAQQLDGMQVMAGEGPGPTAYDSATPVEATDLRADERWPRLARTCSTALGAVSTPLTLGGGSVGCMTVYAAPERVDARLVQTAELLAATVAGIVHHFESRAELATLAAGLEQAMSSRAVIEQAKGIVMATRGCDAEQAFGYLVELSSTEHVKLREVARRIVDGVVPG